MIIKEFKELDSLENKNFYNLLDNIAISSDKKKNNYLGLNPENYICFSLLINNEKQILGFGAVQQYSNNNVRIMTRTYINPLFRTKNILQTNPILSTYLLPYQLDLCLKFNYEKIFISGEKTQAKHFFQYATEKYVGYKNFKLNPYIYKLCNGCFEKCYQYVVTYQGLNLDFEKITENDYLERCIS